MVTDEREDKLLRELVRGHRAGKRLSAVLEDIREQGWGAFYGTDKSQNRVHVSKKDIERLGLRKGIELLFLVRVSR